MTTNDQSCTCNVGVKRLQCGKWSSNGRKVEGSLNSFWEVLHIINRVFVWDFLEKLATGNILEASVELSHKLYIILD